MKRFPTPVFVSILAVALVIAPRAPAQDNPMSPAAPARIVHFAKVDMLDIGAILPDPPAAGSLAARADLDTVLQVQAARTLEQVVWATLVDRTDLFATFGADGLLGPGFTKENFPLFIELGKHANEDLRPLVDAAKKRYSRPRPFAVDARVKPCVPMASTGSYPSGHAYNAYLNAALLAEIFPEKRAELFARARYYAWGRVIGGVHFPTDLEGGRRMAEAGVAELKKSPAFRAAIEQCRAEAAAAAAVKKAA